jgi:flagellar biosynthesis protein FlhF
MEYFTEQALTYSECLSKIREKYGERVTILMRKTVRMGGLFGFFAREGVEVTGIIPQNYAKNISAYKGIAGVSGTGPSGTDFTGSAVSVNSASLAAGQPGYQARQPLDFNDAKQKVIAAANREKDTMQLVLKEVKSLNEKIDARNASSPGEAHPTISRLEEILVLNDFTPAYQSRIRERIKKEFSLDALNDYKLVQDTVLEWIGESITLRIEDKYKRKPRIMVLVGPTGVGKTTTIAKLAAIFGLENNGKPRLSVRLVTIDGFRIGAKAQIDAYGYYMGIPVSYVDDYDELKATIAKNSEGVDLILVDTIGKSPRDYVKLGEMKQFLDACGSFAEIYLVMAATTKSSDLLEILKRFETFDYQSVIVTKVDETIRLGNVVSALADRNKTIAYITDGQKVPSDIKKASVVQFLINLEGFDVNRAKIEKRFPDNEANDNQWR